MLNSWQRSIITQEQFKKLDRWKSTILNNTGTPDPLQNFDYCFLVRKQPPLKREVVFSPYCLQKLCEIQPEFLSLNTEKLSNQIFLRLNETSRPFVSWFGNIHYFSKHFPFDFH